MIPTGANKRRMQLCKYRIRILEEEIPWSCARYNLAKKKISVSGVLIRFSVS